MKTKAMKHQDAALEKSDGKRNFAYLMEQGTGKTWTTLADAERCFIAKKIDALVVIAPNGVHTNWILREVPTHLEVRYYAMAWKGTPNSNVQKRRLEDFLKPYIGVGRGPMKIFSINIDSINTKAGLDYLERVLESCKCMLVMDESTRIKNPKAIRTKKSIKIGRLATCRRILSGAPLTKAPSDLYSQFDFLKTGLLGTSSYAAFVAEYSVLLGPNDPQMIAIMKSSGARFMPQVVKKDDFGLPMYKNLKNLAAMIEPHSYRVRKADCLDLPPKVYKQRFFDLTPKQREIYDRLKNEYEVLLIDLANSLGINVEDVPEESILFKAAGVRMKMKQVTSGYINIYGEPVVLPPEENPRMATFKELFEDIEDNTENQSYIVWAMFDEEIRQLKAYFDSIGIVSEIYNGSTPQATRDRIIDEFQEKKFRVFIGHAAAAGIGITLTAATVAIYYSCSPDNELRLQSEDRCHRIGTVNYVTYYDLIAENTVDETIMRGNAQKTHIASVVIDGAEE